MNNVRKWLLEQLKKRQENGNIRDLELKKDLVDFSSNDYLGLSINQGLRASINEKYQSTGSGIGSTGSRLLTGNSQLHLDLEQALAKYYQAQAALLFNSGYTANLALISSVPQRGDSILYDHAIHACIKEGARLSQAKHFSFRHNDPKDLEKKLKISNGNKFVVIESLYSMEGDYAADKDILEVCQHYGAELIVDEAHTTGWYGSYGKGWSMELGVAARFLGRIYTFGKGMGTYGACVVGSRELIDYLVNFSRPFIYTTALPPHCLISINCALHFIADQPMPGEALQRNVAHYLEIASKLDIPGSRNPGSPIQWIHAGSNKQSVVLSERLVAAGFDLRPIRSPTVPAGQERLRVCLHSFNTTQQITDMLTSINRS